jgi:hypothetical protein
MDKKHTTPENPRPAPQSAKTMIATSLVVLSGALLLSYAFDANELFGKANFKRQALPAQAVVSAAKY